MFRSSLGRGGAPAPTIVQAPQILQAPPGDADGSAAAEAVETEAEPAAKRAKTDGEADGSVDGMASIVPAASSAGAPPGQPDEDSAANLEASLQSCTAHRDRILQMLVEEPDVRACTLVTRDPAPLARSLALRCAPGVGP